MRSVLLLCIILCFAAIDAQNTLNELGLSPTTPAQTAYSLRRLSSQYGGDALRVRRASDNAEALVAFDNAGNVTANSVVRLQTGVALVNANAFTSRTGTISNVESKTGTITISVNKTGTISLDIASTTITGVGTMFTTDLAVGDVLYETDNRLIGTVVSIQSNTQLTLNANAPRTASTIGYRNEEATVVGMLTQFQSELTVGQQLFSLMGTYLGTIKSIASDT